MAKRGDIERRLQIHVARSNGALESNEELAKKYGVDERTIRRDLKYLRENDINWIEEVVNETLVSQYREIYNGYQVDIQEINEILESDMKARDKEVQANLIKIRSELRKERLGLLMKGPAVWYLQKLQRSRQVINVTKDVPKAIFGEEQHNTDIDLAQQALTTDYTPPTLEKQDDQGGV